MKFEVEDPFPFSFGPAVPDSDLVDLDVLDRFGLDLDDLFELFDQEHRRGAFSVISASLHELLITFGFGIEHLQEAFSFSLTDGQDRFSFTFSNEDFAEGFCFGIDLDLSLLDLLRHDLIGF